MWIRVPCNGWAARPGVRNGWRRAGLPRRYEQIMLLRSAVGMAAPQATVPALGAAELVGAALEALGTDADLLAAERARISLLLVDDAQHLDPQAALLVRVLAARSGLTVIAGDPDQSVFGYRGADPMLLRDHGGEDTPAITLTHSHRCAPAVASAISGIARRLPGVGARPRAGGQPERGHGEVTLRMAATPHAENAFIADALRRAHLMDGVPWSEMAVVVRSIPRVGAGLARALSGTGVPVQSTGADLGLAQQPAVAALLTVLEVTASGHLDGDSAIGLLTGPIGRVDPVTLRQLRRALRRADGSTPPRDFADLLVAAIDTEPAGLSAEHVKPLRRLRSVLAAARRGAARRRRSAVHPVAGLERVPAAAALAGRQRAGRHHRSAGGSGPGRGDGIVRCGRPIREPHRGGVTARARGPRGDVGNVDVGFGFEPADRGGRGAQRACRPRPGMGLRGDRRRAGRVVAQHCSAWRHPGHAESRGCARRGGRPGRPRGVDPGAAAGRGATVVDGRHGPGPDPAAGDRGRQRRWRRVTAALTVLCRTGRGGDRIRTAAALRPRRGYCCRRRWSVGCGRWCARRKGAVDDESRSCAATQLARLAAAGCPGPTRRSGTP